MMGGQIRSETVKITTTGSAGAAAGSVTTGSYVGELLGIWLNYHGSAPATTDLTVTAANHGFPVLTVTNAVTNGYKAVSAPVVDAANAAITGAHRPVAIHDKLTLALAQCNALTDALVATIIWRD